MHQALFVLEIVTEIFSHLNPILSESCDRSSECRASLAALARTCKTFYDPAMDLLWAVLDDDWLLLCCVTRLHSSIYNDHHGSCSKLLFSPPDSDSAPNSEDEARQFLPHAARVRSLSVHDTCMLWFLDVDFPTETCLFPGLLSLSWKVQLPMDSRFLHLFLSPTLRHFYLTTIDFDWKSIATHCPVLETLSIVSSSFRAPAAGFISQLSDTVRSCNKLVKLCCPLLDSAALQHISNLPTLVSLEINESGAGTQPLDWNHPNLAPFLSLTDLSLSLRSPFVETVDIMTLIHHSEFPSLRKFVLCSHYVPWERVEQIFRALSQCKACQTLESVSISFDDPEYLGGVRNLLPVIRKLLCFTQLRHLSLFFGGYIDLDNNLLLEAVLSWPHIESMNFHSMRQSAVTFRGLFAALRLCPHLHTLRIWMNVANIDIDPEAESFQHHSLHTLDLRTSNLGNARAVAAIIASMLPCVSQVTYATCDDGSSFWWKEVNLYLSRGF